MLWGFVVDVYLSGKEYGACVRVVVRDEQGWGGLQVESDQSHRQIVRVVETNQPLTLSGNQRQNSD